MFQVGLPLNTRCFRTVLEDLRILFTGYPGRPGIRAVAVRWVSLFSDDEEDKEGEGEPLAASSWLHTDMEESEPDEDEDKEEENEEEE